MYVSTTKPLYDIMLFRWHYGRCQAMLRKVDVAIVRYDGNLLWLMWLKGYCCVLVLWREVLDDCGDVGDDDDDGRGEGVLLLLELPLSNLLQN